MIAFYGFDVSTQVIKKIFSGTIKSFFKKYKGE